MYVVNAKWMMLFNLREKKKRKSGGKKGCWFRFVFCSLRLLAFLVVGLGSLR
jgi:hypothetical protein